MRGYDEIPSTALSSIPNRSARSRASLRNRTRFSALCVRAAEIVRHSPRFFEGERLRHGQLIEAHFSRDRGQAFALSRDVQHAVKRGVGVRIRAVCVFARGGLPSAAPPFTGACHQRSFEHGPRAMRDVGQDLDEPRPFDVRREASANARPICGSGDRLGHAAGPEDYDFCAAEGHAQLRLNLDRTPTGRDWVGARLETADGSYDVRAKLKGTTSFRDLTGKAAFRIDFNEDDPARTWRGLRRMFA